jgi:hypothetical protein
MTDIVKVKDRVRVMGTVRDRVWLGKDKGYSYGSV